MNAMINSSQPLSSSAPWILPLQYSQRSDNILDELSFHDWHIQGVGAVVGDPVGWFSKAYDIVMNNANNKDNIWVRGIIL